MALDQNGHEVLDGTPVAVPIGWHRPPTLQEQMQRYIRNELSRQAQEAGEESFEEADDFEIGDEEELRSPYEIHETPEARWVEDEQRRLAITHAEERLLQSRSSPAQPAPASAAGISGSPNGGTPKSTVP